MVHLFAGARAAAGASQVLVRPGTVSAICAELRSRLPDGFGEVLSVSTLLCDGVRLSIDTQVSVPAGSQVEILPPFAGG
jgi:sulfur-carrier protein